MARPKIRQPYSQPERLLQIVTLIILVGLIGLTVFSMIGLPGRIPSHFGVDGHPDGWSGKGSLLFLPILAVLFYTGLTLLERFPWIYNYPVEITEQNAAAQYKLSRLLLEWGKFAIITVFLYIQWQTARVAKGLSGGIGPWFLPVFLVVILGGSGFLIFKMVRKR